MCAASSEQQIVFDERQAAIGQRQSAYSKLENGTKGQHQQNKSEIVALADKAINYLHYTCL